MKPHEAIAHLQSVLTVVSQSLEIANIEIEEQAAELAAAHAKIKQLTSERYVHRQNMDRAIERLVHFQKFINTNTTANDSVLREEVLTHLRGISHAITGWDRTPPKE